MKSVILKFIVLIVIILAIAALIKGQGGKSSLSPESNPPTIHE